MRKWLLLVIIGILLIPTASAYGFVSCYNVTINCSEPQNLNYTYSINLPFSCSISNNAEACWVEINSEKYRKNKSFSCSSPFERFDVDYDGNYTALVWASNSSAGNCNLTNPFVVDRTSEFEEAKPLLMIFIISMITIFGFIVMFFGRIINKKFQLLINALSFVFIFISFNLILLTAREYIKVPSIYNLLTTAFWATMIVLTLLIMLIGFIFIVDFARKWLNKTKITKYGEN